MIEIVPKKEVGVSEIKILRKISSLSISQIKNASMNRSSIRSFEIFGSDWEEQRKDLASIYHIYCSKKAPFFVVDTDSGEPEQL